MKNVLILLLGLLIGIVGHTVYINNQNIQSVQQIEVQPTVEIKPYISPSLVVADFYNQINKFRISKGLNELQPSADLEGTAANKAEIMINTDCWAHSCGVTDKAHPIDSILKIANVRYAGENLAEGFMTTQDALKAWIASPEHYSVLINEHYTKIGVTIICNIHFQNNDRNCLFVNHFGG